MTETVSTAGPHAATSGLDLSTLSLMLEALDDFIAASLTPELQLELDHEDRCPEDIVRAMSDPDTLGVQLVFIPEEFGGMGGSAWDSYRVCEAMARKDIGLATAVFATFLGSDPIVFGGTPEQQEHWLTRIAGEGLVFAYGATEPEAGSDLGAMTTTAERITADDGTVTAYRITGRKQWISNGSIADFSTVLAATEDGPSWFVVPQDSAGFSSGPPEDKHGLRLSNTSALYLDDVEVPADHLIGEVEGKGLVQAQNVFGYTRLMVAAFGLGGGWEALDRSLAYSVERVQGGSPLSEKQGFTHKLIVPWAVRLEAARSFIEHTATRLDAGAGAEGALNTEGAIAKYMSTEAGIAAADAAIQAHGGYGYTRPYVVEKIRRDVRITTIYEGTSEIMEMTIARDRWQRHLKSGGRHYSDMADRLEAMHAAQPSAGADIAALACRALAVVLEACRTGRLTRNQHVLFRLGELIAWTETAAVFVTKAAAAAEQSLHEKCLSRFDADALAVMSRVFAREAAQKVALEGTRWVAGASEPGSAQLTTIGDVPTARIMAAQAGLVTDLDTVRDILYAPFGSGSPLSATG
ncbi:acyl-CoA dehydrogenase [Nostocoides sp. F2B08]|uniref:acyl-CoA dehydrogenase family protein n=1 Tax=Nostocoides sp. F2B08 TaxID=2653936 RepID=UPI001262B99A|nr:acyl-CoA dehydrogenase family protein [Tetrasphaera sp. F2B08]KAB7742497.1 acyl-CoA dehydrogenase [Tetrasphaera sp. F2B08]